MRRSGPLVRWPCLAARILPQGKSGRGVGFRGEGVFAGDFWGSVGPAPMGRVDDAPPPRMQTPAESRVALWGACVAAVCFVVALVASVVSKSWTGCTIPLHSTMSAVVCNRQPLSLSGVLPRQRSPVSPRQRSPLKCPSGG